MVENGTPDFIKANMIDIYIDRHLFILWNYQNGCIEN